MKQASRHHPHGAPRLTTSTERKCMHALPTRLLCKSGKQPVLICALPANHPCLLTQASQRSWPQPSLADLRPTRRHARMQVCLCRGRQSSEPAKQSQPQSTAIICMAWQLLAITKTHTTSAGDETLQQAGQTPRRCCQPPSAEGTCRVAQHVMPDILAHVHTCISGW